MKHIRLLSVIILLIGISLIACMKESRFYPESESLKILSNKEGVVEVEAKLSKKANKNFNYITEFGFVVSESPMTIDNDTITSSKNISYYSFIKGNTISKTDTSTNAENEFVFKKSIIGLKLNTNYYIRSFTRVGNNKRSGYSEEELSCILSTTAIVVGFNAPITTTLNQVTFTNTSINADTYEWDFGDNASTTNTSSAKNPTHSFSGFGTYTVTLKAKNTYTTNSISKVITILSVIANFNAPETTTLNPVTFTNTSTNANSYLWDFGDPSSGISNTSNQANPNHNFTENNKSYTVTLTAFNSFTQHTISKIITIIDPNTIKIGQQYWKLKDLDVVYFSNGDPIQQAISANDWNMKLLSGIPAYRDLGSVKVYNTYAVNDTRGLAPIGYHIPNEIEWSQLINFLGGSNFAGKKMKSSTDWNGNNESGFNAYHNGYINSSGNFDSPDQGFWWVKNSNNNCLFLSTGNDKAIITSASGGFSVRCIKD